MAREGKKHVVVVDGKEEKQYNGVLALIFSPDSQRVAYMAELGDKQFVVVDGKEAREYDNLIVIGGGRIIFDSSDTLHYLAQEGDDMYLVEEKIR